MPHSRAQIDPKHRQQGTGRSLPDEKYGAWKTLSQWDIEGRDIDVPGDPGYTGASRANASLLEAVGVALRE
jgi:hypothetical protein